MSKQRAGLLAIGLLALTTVPAMTSADIKYVLQCGNAKSVPPDDDDPVLLTRIVAIADGKTQNGEIYIRHFVASGENYTRNKQYRDLRFWSEGQADYWSGTSVKFPDRTRWLQLKLGRVRGDFTVVENPGAHTAFSGFRVAERTDGKSLRCEYRSFGEGFCVSASE
jgi:hypothetical protein